MGCVESKNMRSLEARRVQKDKHAKEAAEFIEKGVPASTPSSPMSATFTDTEASSMDMSLDFTDWHDVTDGGVKLEVYETLLRLLPDAILLEILTFTFWRNHIEKAYKMSPQMKRIMDKVPNVQSKFSMLKGLYVRGYNEEQPRFWKLCDPDIYWKENALRTAPNG